MKARKKILLVDDSNTVLMMHRMLLSEQDYDLVFARNGQEAVDKAASEHPDLIFLDVLMPVMNGFDACRALRAAPATRNVPIIMVTTRGEPQNVEAGFAAGCTEYMTKPFNSLELLSKLRSHLGEEGGA